MKFLISIFLLSCAFTLTAQNQKLSNGLAFDGEPYLVVNPANPDHIVVAWMGFVSFAEKFQIKTRASFDGGLTWSSTAALPHAVTGYTSADPSLDFDAAGNVVACYIDFTGTTPPISGAVFIRKSTDGGLTWGNAQEVINANFDGTKWPIDRPWMKIDKGSSTTQGNIYVTTFNGNRTNAPYNPYLSVSTDGGNSFTSRFLDTTGYLAGSLNALPVCSPTISSTGVFYGVYPSYVPTQNVFAQAFLASSSNGGVSISHKVARTDNPPSQIGNYPDAKKASLLLSNPQNANHLALIFLSAKTGDIDVYLTESLNQGTSWTSPERINDDPLTSGAMQDMIWGDFDYDGDLVISWRDRRNGASTGYDSDSEIWAAVRSADSSQFEPNFQITNQLVAYDTILKSSGNDFMCISLEHDTIYAVWGDVRSGKIEIWFQKTDLNGNRLSIQQLTESLQFDVYPNPTTSMLTVSSLEWKKINVYDANSRLVTSFENKTQADHYQLDLSRLKSGAYFIEVTSKQGVGVRKVIKQ